MLPPAAGEIKHTTINRSIPVAEPLTDEFNTEEHRFNAIPPSFNQSHTFGTHSWQKIKLDQTSVATEACCIFINPQEGVLTSPPFLTY